MKAIRLPNSARVSIPSYLHAWRASKESPAALFSGWGGAPVTGADIHRDILRGMHDRINWRGRIEVAPDDARWHAWRSDQRAIEDYRLRRIVRRGSGLETKEARQRVPDVHAAFMDRGN